MPLRRGLCGGLEGLLDQISAPSRFGPRPRFRAWLSGEASFVHDSMVLSRKAGTSPDSAEADSPIQPASCRRRDDIRGRFVSLRSIPVYSVERGEVSRADGARLG